MAAEKEGLISGKRRRYGRYPDQRFTPDLSIADEWLRSAARVHPEARLDGSLFVPNERITNYKVGFVSSEVWFTCHQNASPIPRDVGPTRIGRISSKFACDGSVQSQIAAIGLAHPVGSRVFRAVDLTNAHHGRWLSTSYQSVLHNISPTARNFPIRIDEIR